MTPGRNSTSGNLLASLGAAGRVLFLRHRLPFSVSFAVTYRCSLNCLYCGCKDVQVPEMSTGEALRLIGEMASAGTRRLGFTGGEPLLREDVGRLIEEASRLSMTTTLCSNGLLVSERIAELKNLDYLFVSLDSPPAVHERLRGGGSYEKALQAVESAVRAHIRVWTVCVLSKENASRVGEILKTAEELGCATFFNPIFEFSLASPQAGDYAADWGEMREAAEYLLEAKRKGAPVVNSILFLKSLLSPRPDSKRCLAGEFFCAVGPDGSVSPCYPLLNEEALPNALEMGFRTAFEAAVRPACRTCRCGSHIELNLHASLRPAAFLSAADLFLSTFRSTRKRP